MYYLTETYPTNYISDIDNTFNSTPWHMFKDVYKPIFDCCSCKLIHVTNDVTLPRAVVISTPLGETNLAYLNTGAKALMLAAAYHKHSMPFSCDISMFGRNLLKFLQKHKDIFGDIVFYSNSGIVMRDDYTWEEGEDYEYIM